MAESVWVHADQGAGEQITVSTQDFVSVWSAYKADLIWAGVVNVGGEFEQVWGGGGGFGQGRVVVWSEAQVMVHTSCFHPRHVRCSFGFRWRVTGGLF